MTTTTAPRPSWPAYRTPSARGVVLVGSCLDRLRELPDNSIDAVVCDPPYGLTDIPTSKFVATLTEWLTGDRAATPTGKGFMGRGWDSFVPPPALWDQVFRVLKPGGHLLAFAGSRTVDLMATSIRLAGFAVRDSIPWFYGSGMPKSLDVAKAIDKAAGATRKVVGTKRTNVGIQGGNYSAGSRTGDVDITVPATEDARRWDGWGTALKPAHEPIVLARKPLSGTVAATVLEWGTGALNIDGCRVGSEVRHNPPCRTPDGTPSLGGGWTATEGTTATGRWPANLLFTHDARCRQVGERTGELTKNTGAYTDAKQADGWGTRRPETTTVTETTAVFECVPGCPVAALDAQSGGASRFFPTLNWDPAYDAPFRYVAKPSKKERNAGLDGLPTRGKVYNGASDTAAGKAPGSVEDKFSTKPQANTHPTVKPVALMRWLIRLITPPGGVVLDPFLGSGTTAVAAELEGHDWIGCELTAEYLPIIEGRVRHAAAEAAKTRQLDLFEAS